MRFDIAGKLELKIQASVPVGSQSMQIRGVVTIPMLCPVCQCRFGHTPGPIYSWNVRVSEDDVKPGWYHLQDWPKAWGHVLSNLVNYPVGDIACKECGVVSRLSASAAEVLRPHLLREFNNERIYTFMEDWGFKLDKVSMQYTFEGLAPFSDEKVLTA